MTKNEIVARFCRVKNMYFENGLSFNASTDYNDLMKAWIKFRDLEFDDKEKNMRHDEFCDRIGNDIVFYSITEAFDELVKGIEWYNSLKNTT